ncbi:SPOR domain-containing protein [Pseudidiomarina woesei]|uniref:Cell division protein DedD (Periplasmic protein involved in septation) n=1 Tax=Pseudidiomarina woesei TaxID=1381080 RepID=A0A0K6GXY8_9GAMM|nr:SPOR domain-containing protein [Pseudidiomarina woesei]CUA83576.1 Cell division protein DedD (periplasmic protein involved in septation) [Pseudidiomarina woesei]
MASQLQNRLVGSIILIALAVIILPELLDGKPQQQQESFETIPLQPEVEVAEQAVQEIPARDLPPSLDNIETVEIDAEEAPQLSEQNIAESRQEVEQIKPTQAAVTEPGWVIQLGVFSNQASVERLLKQLREAGYTAYAEPIKTSSGPASKVLVGPSLVKSELELMLPKLKNLTNLNGQLRRYEP